MSNMGCVMAPEQLIDSIRHPALEPLRPLPRLLVFVYLIVACIYLGWRATTLNPDTPVFSGLLYGAELFGFATTLLHLFMTWRLTVRMPIQARTDRDAGTTKSATPQERLKL